MVKQRSPEPDSRQEGDSDPQVLKRRPVLAWFDSVVKKNNMFLKVPHFQEVTVVALKKTTKQRMRQTSGRSGLNPPIHYLFIGWLGTPRLPRCHVGGWVGGVFGGGRGGLMMSTCTSSSVSYNHCYMLAAATMNDACLCTCPLSLSFPLLSPFTPPPARPPKPPTELS